MNENIFTRKKKRKKDEILYYVLGQCNKMQLYNENKKKEAERARARDEKS